MKILVVLLSIILSNLVFSQVVQINNDEAIVKYVHVSEKVEGTLTGIKVDIKLNTRDITKSQIIGRVDATTLKSGIKLRDGHLQQKGYFFTEEFPFMTFTSDSFKKLSTTSYEVTGRLKIKDITKEVTWVFNEDTFAWTGKTEIYTNDFEIHQKRNREKTKVEITIILPLK